MAAAILNGQTTDQQLIKKAYKLIPRLATTETGAAALRERSGELQSLILATADKTPTSARRDRMLAIYEVVTYLPSTDLHFIPSVLSEVVLGCKESNEKARTASFDLLIHLTKRTIDPEQNPAGIKIRNALVPHMPDDAPDAPATIEEFFTMVSAGLAGSAPHMVAATVTALSRLFFDFHTQLQPSVRTDLVQTVELFLTSNNREIVRSVLGFVKVAVVVLPDEVLRERLESLVPSLMAWNKEHKGRLRSKVKGILDRLVRRFGAPLVESLVGDADRKLVVNIRKQRERRKRKKRANGAEEDGDDDHNNASANQGKQESQHSNAFDKAVYDSASDSDSDLDSDDDASEIEVDEQGTLHTNPNTKINPKKSKKSKSTKDNKQYIRELSPEDNPLDLLAPNALAHISTTKPSVRFLNTGPGAKKKQRNAKIDADGKLVFGDDDDEDDDMDGGAGESGDGGVNAYLAAVSGPDAARRGQKGKVKMSQPQAKKKDASGDGMDIDGGDDAEISKDDLRAAAAAGANAGRGGRGGRRGLGMGKSHGASIGGGGRVQKKRGGPGGGGNARGKQRGKRR